jgi:hypothetical protein
MNIGKFGGKNDGSTGMREIEIYTLPGFASKVDVARKVSFLPQKSFRSVISFGQLRSTSRIW